MPRHRRSNSESGFRINISEKDFSFLKSADLSTYSQLPLRDRANIELAYEIASRRKDATEPGRQGEAAIATRVADLKSNLAVLFQMENDPFLKDKKLNTQKVKQLLDSIEKFQNHMKEINIQALNVSRRKGLKSPYDGVLQESVELANKLLMHLRGKELDLSPSDRARVRGLQKEISAIRVRSQRKQLLKKPDSKKLKNIEKQRLRDLERARLYQLEQQRLHDQELLRLQEERLQKLELEQERLKRERQKTQPEMAAGVNVQDLRIKAEQRKQERMEQNARLDDLNVRLKSLEKSAQRQSEELERTKLFEQRFNEISGRMDVLANENRQLKERVQTLERRPTPPSHTQDIQDLRSQLIKLNSKVIAHDTFDTRLDAHDSSLNRLGSEVHVLKEQVNSHSTRLSAYEQELQRLNRKISELPARSEAEHLKQELSRLSAQISIHQNVLQQLDGMDFREVSRARGMLNDVARRIDNLSQRVAEHDKYEARLEEHGRSLQKLSDKIKGVDIADLIRLRQEHDQLNVQHRALGRKIEGNERRLNEHNAKLDTHDDALRRIDGVDFDNIRDLGRQVDTLRREFDTDHLQLGQVRHDYAALRGDFNADHAQLGNLQVAFNADHAMLVADDAMLQADHLQLGQVRGDHAALRGEFNADHAQLGNLQAAFNADHAMLVAGDAMLQADHLQLGDLQNAFNVDHTLLQNDHQILTKNSTMLSQYQQQTGGNLRALIFNMHRDISSGIISSP